jgi:hypothetical protein
MGLQASGCHLPGPPRTTTEKQSAEATLENRYQRQGDAPVMAIHNWVDGRQAAQLFEEAAQVFTATGIII